MDARTETEAPVSITLPPDERALSDLFAFIDVVCDAAACSKRVRFDLRLALEELFVNVARHGFPEGRPHQPVHLRAAVGDDAALHITMADAGVPYDPLAYDPQLVSAEKGAGNKVGGLGIFLVRARTDGLSYEHKDGMNVLHITKSLA